LEKLKGKRITYDIFLFLLSVFHIETPIEDKYRFILRYFRYLFRLYDVDGDLKVGVNDLVSIFEMIFYGPAYNHNVYQMMAEQLVAKHGTAGFIKL
jgi:Ca2+-binding EF-hand superfamily protein